MVKENQQCISCGAGHYSRVLQDITLDTQHGRKVTIPAVEVFKCSACGDEVIPAASHNYIDRRIADEDEQLSPADVRKSFDALGDSLTEISQTIGIGSKTPGRWHSGSQHPTKA
jgi:YgiT-type zinc finger domain-containing protein